ncbi:unnamed protein product [marine sediment metagenome]|uniref:Uncharacterized protein n=1 Tax=marine sediment metagenome TaxID=412755 RepID=X0YHL8_9ZZZZ
MNQELIRIERTGKIIILLIISVITGIIGLMTGIYIASAMRVVSGGEIFALIGFLAGFFAPIFIYNKRKHYEV